MAALAKLTSKGQVTVPLDIRQEMQLQEGDFLAWEVDAQGIATVRRVMPVDVEYLRALESTLGEWTSKADEDAYRDL